MTFCTPLLEEHKRDCARLTDFSGWEMPIQYGSITAEHAAVREEVGIFDVGHMGRLFLRGQQSVAILERITVSRMTDLTPGRTRYTAVCNPEGGTKDDILVTCLEPDRFLLVVNASNRDKLVSWFGERLGSETPLQDVTFTTGMIAVQGPKALGVVNELLNADLHSLRYYHTCDLGNGLLVSRTGYTGEDGFEIIASPSEVVSFWQRARALGAKPIGLGARDTLRMEMGYPLYGHELAEDITPLEAGIGWVVHFDKSDFIGKSALERQKQNGVPRQRIGFLLKESGIPRPGYSLFQGGKPLGIVTSGGFSPTLGMGIGLGLIRNTPETIDALFVEIRGKKVPVSVQSPPFVQKKVRK